jgi:murein DD-endopeptidase MepM/ murein hydrolase activator NlpD
MKLYVLKKAAIVFLILTFSLIFVEGVFAEEKGEVQLNKNDEVQTLRQQIDERSVELDVLQGQQAELEEKLRQTGEEKGSLERELLNINWRVNQLEISMRSNRLTIEKLGLERQSLNEVVKNTEAEIENKKDTVGRLLVKLQQKDNESFLAIFLKSSTLSENISEIQSIMMLEGNLTKSVNQLRDLQTNLIQESNEIKNKERGIEIEQKTLENRQYLVTDQKNEKQYLLTQTKSQEQVYKEKIAELDQKQAEISQVMSGIEEKLRLTLDPSLLPVKRSGLLALPVKTDSCVTQWYGRTEFARTHYHSKFHRGIDFRAPFGEPVFAAMDGTIAVVDNNDKGITRWQKYQYGKYVMIEHNNNLSTLYAHLSRQVVKEGETVNQGDIIGFSGNTGYSFGAHLHFGVYVTPIIGWRQSYSEGKARESGGLIEIPPAAGLVPVGVTLNPMDYLPHFESCYQ